MGEDQPEIPSDRSEPRVQTIGDFELLARLGQGGMGTVYKARQRSLDRIVALKLLPPALAQDAAFIERFQREARASAKLNHPNIVQGINVGRDATTGQWYFAMELVEGPTLKKVLAAEKKIDEPRVIDIARDIAQALDCAHRNGFVHRDIKPDNILLAPDGTAKLADLGLARRVDGGGDDATLTGAGLALGTPAYMSPEQIRSERDKVDIRSDIYSLGATLFHLLTGRPPYTGPSSAVILSNHLTQKVPLAHQVEPGVSERLSRLIAQMMQKEREGRLRSPAALLAALEKLNAPDRGAPRRSAVPAPATDTHERASRIPEQKGISRGVLVCAVAGGVVLLGAILLVAFRSPPANEKSAHPTSVTKTPSAPPQPQPAIPPVAAPSVVTPESAAPKIINVREELAQSGLIELKKRQTQEPLDVAVVRKLYEEFVGRYGSTQAGKEAAEILRALPAAPPAPAPVTKTETPPVATDLPATPVPAPPETTPPATPEALAACSEVIAETHALLRTQQFGVARDALAKARAKPELASLHTELDRESQCVGLAEAAVRAALDGAAQLAKEKPAFSFVKTDGKEIKTGAGTKNHVGRVRDETIEIEQDLGGGTATLWIPLTQLTPRTVYGLARLALQDSSESRVKLAAWGLVALSSGSDEPSGQELLRLLDGAAPADLAEHLGARVKSFEREAEVGPALKRVDPLLKEKRWEAALEALRQLKQTYAGTVALKKLLPEFEQRWAQADGELHPLKPGLWCSIWTADYSKKLLARVDSNLSQNFAAGSPDPTVPNDWFNMRLAGILRVEREGKYVFSLYADDYLALYIDGKLLGEAGTPWVKSAVGATLQLGKEIEVALTKGDHEVKIEFKEALGNAAFTLRWTPPGGPPVVLPVDVLWHDPRKTESYERAP